MHGSDLEDPWCLLLFEAQGLDSALGFCARRLTLQSGDRISSWGEGSELGLAGAGAVRTAMQHPRPSASWQAPSSPHERLGGLWLSWGQWCQSF
jgi:hypothetical protein